MIAVVKEDDSSAGYVVCEALHQFNSHKTGSSNRPMAQQDNLLLRWLMETDCRSITSHIVLILTAAELSTSCGKMIHQLYILTREQVWRSD